MSIKLKSYSRNLRSKNTLILVKNNDSSLIVIYLLLSSSSLLNASSRVMLFLIVDSSKRKMNSYFQSNSGFSSYSSISVCLTISLYNCSSYRHCNLLSMSKSVNRNIASMVLLSHSIPIWWKALSSSDLLTYPDPSLSTIWNAFLIDIFEFLIALKNK